MEVVIIEDELLTAEDLKDILLQVNEKVQVQAVLPSVKEAVNFFRNNPPPDLIFSDIQLGDGLSFEIFEQVNVKAPIIFCTAYSEYAIKAFKANGIHYILKPFDEKVIQTALDKYRTLQQTFENKTVDLQQLLEVFSSNKEARPASLLVYHKDQIIPVKLEEVAVAYIHNEVTHLLTFHEKTYLINKTLDEVHQAGGPVFYRANRQFLIHRDAVKNVSQYLARKVSVTLKTPFDEVITVSKEKVTDFLEWLEGAT